MKNQYFGDRRDLFKYELLLDLVECVKGRRLLIIPMLTPNDDTREGRLVNYSLGSRRRLLYDSLRKAVASSKRDVRVLRTLMPKYRVRYRPYRDSEYFENESRTEYFSKVRPNTRVDTVIFFDPDVGLQVGTPEYMGKSGAASLRRECL